jgi:pimeloyl-ACP methyl ester carboxylesterase
MEHLVLLHGALGSKEQLLPFETFFKSKFKVHLVNFSGHGGAPFQGEFSIEQFAAELKEYLDENQLTEVAVFGYSMGGYVALYLARHYPEYIKRIITLGTKFHWDNETSLIEVGKLNPTNIEQKVPKFAEVLRHRHQPNNWHEVLLATADMMLRLGQKNVLTNSDYEQIQVPVLCCIGDLDEMVTLEETIYVYRALGNANLFVVPNTKHPIERINIDVFLTAMMQFLLKK